MIIAVLVLILMLYGLVYLFQEKMIFFPEKLSTDYQFSFPQDFEEINLQTNDQKTLNGLLFKAQNPKGLIFYLHGNAGALDSWAEVAPTYTRLGYDVFILDYRGFGKSSGRIHSQAQLFSDAQLAYSEMQKRYQEDKIVVLGYSIGTGMASKIAASNQPKMLILQAPYFSLVDLIQHKFPIIPAFLIKYQLRTDQYLKECKMPVVIFHGDQDEVIYYESSLKLEKILKASDKMVTLKGQAHGGITDNPVYLKVLAEILP